MGDISEWIVMIPSYCLSGEGLTIFASTCAITLEELQIAISEANPVYPPGLPYTTFYISEFSTKTDLNFPLLQKRTTIQT